MDSLYWGIISIFAGAGEGFHRTAFKILVLQPGIGQGFHDQQ